MTNAIGGNVKLCFKNLISLYLDLVRPNIHHNKKNSPSLNDKVKNDYEKCN